MVHGSLTWHQKTGIFTHRRAIASNDGEKILNDRAFVRLTGKLKQLSFERFSNARLNLGELLKWLFFTQGVLISFIHALTKRAKELPLDLPGWHEAQINRRGGIKLVIIEGKADEVCVVLDQSKLFLGKEVSNTARNDQSAGNTSFTQNWIGRATVLMLSPDWYNHASSRGRRV